MNFKRCLFIAGLSLEIFSYKAWADCPTVSAKYFCNEGLWNSNMISLNISLDPLSEHGIRLFYFIVTHPLAQLDNFISIIFAYRREGHDLKQALETGYSFCTDKGSIILSMGDNKWEYTLSRDKSRVYVSSLQKEIRSGTDEFTWRRIHEETCLLMPEQVDSDPFQLSATGELGVSSTPGPISTRGLFSSFENKGEGRDIEPFQNENKNRRKFKKRKADTSVAEIERSNSFSAQAFKKNYFTAFQILQLLNLFHSDEWVKKYYPNDGEKEIIAQKVKISIEEVERYFNNQRQLMSLK